MSKGKSDVVKGHAKSRKITQVRAGSAEYKGYVSYPRTAAIKARFDAWVNEDDTVSDVVTTALEMGYRLTITPEDDGATIKAAWYQNDNQRVDAGLGISAFSDNYGEALALVCYFLSVEGEFSLLSEFFTQPNDKKQKSFWGDAT